MAHQGLPPLTDDEKFELAALLKRTIDADRYPFSPWINVRGGGGDPGLV